MTSLRDRIAEAIGQAAHGLHDCTCDEEYCRFQVSAVVDGTPVAVEGDLDAIADAVLALFECCTETAEMDSVGTVWPRHLIDRPAVQDAFACAGDRPHPVRRTVLTGPWEEAGDG